MKKFRLINDSTNDDNEVFESNLCEFDNHEIKKIHTLSETSTLLVVCIKSVKMNGKLLWEKGTLYQIKDHDFMFLKIESELGPRFISRDNLFDFLRFFKIVGVDEY